jgi:hypothetical protein
VGVESSVASGFSLGGGHALEVKRVNGTGDVLLHDGEDLLLPLQGANALKVLGNDANVKVVA